MAGKITKKKSNNQKKNPLSQGYGLFLVLKQVDLSLTSKVSFQLASDGVLPRRWS